MRFSEDDGHLSVYRQPSMNSNGNTIDREGRLITCEHTGRRVTRTELDGSITIIADKYNGKKLNSPNDVVVAADGSIWFCDPGLRHRRLLRGHQGRRRAGQEERLPGRPEIRRHQGVVDDFVEPNGICLLARREEALCLRYRLHRRAGQPVAYPRVRRGSRAGKLSNSKVFADMPKPSITDGLRCDTDGRALVLGVGWGDPNEDGVRCYTPDGDLLGKIHIPETVANLCFGGQQRNRLYICGSSVALCGLYECAGRDEAVKRASLLVVPRVAPERGPITTGRRAGEGCLHPALSTDHAVWVPAFAGTTARVPLTRYSATPPKSR